MTQESDRTPNPDRDAGRANGANAGRPPDGSRTDASTPEAHEPHEPHEPHGGDDGAAIDASTLSSSTLSSSTLSPSTLSPSSGLCGGPGQISCEEANEMIQLVIDHLTDDTDQLLLQVHLGDCPPCEQELFVYQRIVAALVRTRPRIPRSTAERLTEYCDGLCSDNDRD